MPPRPVALVLALVALATPRALHAADGELDTSFSADGRQTVAWDSSADGEAVAAGADGSLVVAGELGAQWAASRLNASGGFDVTWAIVFDPFDFVAAGASDTRAVLCAHIDGAGRVLLAGEVRDAADRFRPAVARLTATGALDSSFGGDGLEVVASVPAGWDLDPVEDAHIATDGSVVFVGACGDCPAAGQDGVFVVRLTPSGAPDPAFSGDGWHAFPVSSLAGVVPTAVAVSPAGAITLAGSGDDGVPEERIWVARLTAAGALDAAFGGGDGLLYTPSYAPRVPTDLAIDPDTGAIVLSVAHPLVTVAGGGLVGVTGSGTLDTSFGTNGLLDLDLEEGARIEAVSFQSDGRVVAAGEIDANGTQPGGFFLVRTLADGTLDASFDGNGLKRVEIDRTPNATDAALSLTLSGGRLVAAGYARGDSLPTVMAVVRTASELIFTDGFESGGTFVWGGS